MVRRRRIGAAFRDEACGGGRDIVDVDDAPLAAQPLPVLASVPGRAAVVDVEHADSAAREERDSSGCRARDVRRRSAVHQQDVRREFAVRRADVRVARRVVEGVHRAVRAVVDHGAGLRHPFRSRRRCAPGDALRLGGPVDVDQPEGRGRFVRGSGEENPRARHVLDRDARAHIEREWAHHAGRRIDHDDLVAAVGADRHDASVVQPGVPPGAQHPQRAAGVGVRGREVLVVEPGVQAHAPEVPPAASSRRRRAGPRRPATPAGAARSRRRRRSPTRRRCRPRGGRCAARCDPTACRGGSRPPRRDAVPPGDRAGWARKSASAVSSISSHTRSVLISTIARRMSDASLWCSRMASSRPACQLRPP